MSLQINLTMLGKIIIQAVAVLAIMTVIAAVSMMPKAVAQTSSSSNATSAAPDAVEKMFSKAPQSKVARAGEQDKYSAWLMICAAPPITNVETQCDVPVQLH